MRPLRSCSERGAKVVLGARGLDRLEALADRIVRAGGEAVYARTDVERREDLSNLVNLACERYGKLDVLVNNAGIMPVSPLDDLRVKDWEEMIDINIKGVLYGIAAALPIFRKQGFGHFVNSASTAGHKTVPNQSVYSGTKFAFTNFTTQPFVKHILVTAESHRRRQHHRAVALHQLPK